MMMIIMYFTAEQEWNTPRKEEIEIAISLLKHKQALGKDTTVAKLLKNGEPTIK